MSKPFCTYLTTYFGNKLPQFYIGYSTIEKINKGYRGSVSSKEYKQIWRYELSTNPHLFKTTIICTHVTREDAREHEIFLQKYFQVDKNPMYINRSIGGIKFCFCVKHSNETKLKMSKAGRGRPKSDETKKKMSLSQKGRTLKQETIEKIKISRKGKGLGERNSMASQINIDKIKQVVLEKYGVENVFCSEEIKEKIRNTNIIKYGVSHIEHVRSKLILYAGNTYKGHELLKLLDLKPSQLAYFSNNNLNGLSYCE